MIWPAARGFRVTKFVTGFKETSGEEEVDVGRETVFESRETSVVVGFEEISGFEEMSGVEETSGVEGGDESVVVDGEVVDGEVVDGEVVDGEVVVC